jgi:hypothetical protein
MKMRWVLMVLSRLLFNKSFIFFRLFEGETIAVNVMGTMVLLLVTLCGVQVRNNDGDSRDGR